jgi:murein DD-endopeptidase MepM/ murein hydrolase activator NlpD
MKTICLICCFSFAASAFAEVRFRLPLSADTTKHYYYDHEKGGKIADWRCAKETYDGHRGTDFSSVPRGLAIYSAAIGTLDYKIDGFGDGHYGSTDGGGFGNYVRLAHADGFKTYYGHMTVGSVTAKTVGSAIACGEQVGGVGTSGSSTGLHLHFEPRKNGVSDDPFSGTCGGPISWWFNQGTGSPSTICQ